MIIHSSNTTVSLWVPVIPHLRETHFKIFDFNKDWFFVFGANGNENNSRELNNPSFSTDLMEFCICFDSYLFSLKPLVFVNMIKYKKGDELISIFNREEMQHWGVSIMSNGNYLGEIVWLFQVL